MDHKRPKTIVNLQARCSYVGYVAIVTFSHETILINPFKSQQKNSKTLIHN